MNSSGGFAKWQSATILEKGGFLAVVSLKPLYRFKFHTVRNINVKLKESLNFSVKALVRSRLGS
jgi:hypothetical protein